MDHTCYKCGHGVEDGKPFCLQCGAPQIRVAMPEVTTSNVAGNAVAAELPIFSSDSPLGAGPLQAPTLSPGIVWPMAVRSCAIAALIAALVMIFGLVVPLLAVLGAGLLAVNLYHRQNPIWSVNARSGAQLGAACGALFFGLATIFEAFAQAVLHMGGELRQKVLEAMQQAASRSSDPQVQAAFDQLKTPEGIAVMLAFALVVLFVFSIIAGSLAGALTGAFLGRRKRR